MVPSRQPLDPEVARIFLRKIYRRYLALQEADLDDLVAMAILKVVVAALKDPSRAMEKWTATYLRAAGRSALSDWMRQKAPLVSGDAEEIEEIGVEDREFRRREADLVLEQIKSSLSEGERDLLEAIASAAIQGKEDQVVAQELGLPASTFGSRKIRLLGKIEAAFRTDRST